MVIHMLSEFMSTGLYIAVCISGAATLTSLLFKAVAFIEHPRKR